MFPHRSIDTCTSTQENRTLWCFVHALVLHYSYIVLKSYLAGWLLLDGHCISLHQISSMYKVELPRPRFRQARHKFIYAKPIIVTSHVREPRVPALRMQVNCTL